MSKSQKKKRSKRRPESRHEEPIPVSEIQNIKQVPKKKKKRLKKKTDDPGNDIEDQPQIDQKSDHKDRSEQNEDIDFGLSQGYDSIQKSQFINLDDKPQIQTQQTVNILLQRDNLSSLNSSNFSSSNQ